MSEIKGTFKLDISPAQAALRAMDGRLQSLGSRMLWVNNIAKSASTVINGAFGAITPVPQNVRQAFDMGGKLSDLAAMTGQTASEVLVLRQAFANNGLAAADAAEEADKKRLATLKALRTAALDNLAEARKEEELAAAPDAEAKRAILL